MPSRSSTVLAHVVHSVLFCSVDVTMNWTGQDHVLCHAIEKIIIISVVLQDFEEPLLKCE